MLENTELNAGYKRGRLAVLDAKSGNLAPFGGVNCYSGTECGRSETFGLANLANLAERLVLKRQVVAGMNAYRDFEHRWSVDVLVV
jgi:hypothetical protein